MEWAVPYALALFVAMPALHRMRGPFVAFLESARDFTDEYNSMYLD